METGDSGLLLLLRLPWVRAVLWAGCGALVRIPSASVRWWVLAALLGVDVVAVAIAVAICSKREEEPGQGRKSGKAYSVPNNGSGQRGASGLLALGVAWWLTGEILPRKDAVGLKPGWPRPDEHLSGRVGNKEAGQDLQSDHLGDVSHPYPKGHPDEGGQQRPAGSDEECLITDEIGPVDGNTTSYREVDYAPPDPEARSETEASGPAPQEEAGKKMADLMHYCEHEKADKEEAKDGDQGVDDLHEALFDAPEAIPTAFWLIRLLALAYAGYLFVLG